MTFSFSWHIMRIMSRDMIIAASTMYAKKIYIYVRVYITTGGRRYAAIYVV